MSKKGWVYVEGLEDKVYIGSARNFEMYKHLVNKGISKSYNVQGNDGLPSYLLVYDGGMVTHYDYTDFWGFDCFLFERWSPQIRQTFGEINKK